MNSIKRPLAITKQKMLCIMYTCLMYVVFSYVHSTSLAITGSGNVLLCVWYNRSDSGSCSSRTSNLSSLTKSSGICQSQSPGSIAALSDAVSTLYLSPSLSFCLDY